MMRTEPENLRIHRERLTLSLSTDELAAYTAEAAKCAMSPSKWAVLTINRALCGKGKVPEPTKPQ